jgi:hypothetical protein
MNPLNYATLEASQRLHAKGIVLETEAVWCHYSTDKFSHPNKWSLGYRGLVESDPRKDDRPFIPAPSMAEVWRELPQNLNSGEDIGALMIYKREVYANEYLTVAGYWWHEVELCSFVNTNPTDALVDLLIWITEQRKEEV